MTYRTKDKNSQMYTIQMSKLGSSNSNDILKMAIHKFTDLNLVNLGMYIFNV